MADLSADLVGTKRWDGVFCWGISLLLHINFGPLVEDSQVPRGPEQYYYD